MKTLATAGVVALAVFGLALLGAWATTRDASTGAVGIYNVAAFNGAVIIIDTRDGSAWSWGVGSKGKWLKFPPIPISE